MGTVLKVAGYGLAPITEGASLVLIAPAEVMDLVGTTIDVSLDVSEGDYGDAASKVVIQGVFKASGDAISKEAISKSWTWVDDAIMNAINESWKKLSEAVNEAASDSRKKEEEKPNKN